MTSLQIALIPGEKILVWIMLFFQVQPHSLHPDLFVVFTYLLSYLFWLLILKAVWKISLRITNFDQSRGRR